MTDTTKLLVEAAGEAVSNIAERYDGYHTDLITRFTEVLRIQREETNRAAIGSIKTLIAGFANEVAAHQRSASE